MEFNESNIECSYILNLLYNFYIPTIDIVDPSANPDKFQINEHYITRDGALYLNTENGKKYISTYNSGKQYLGITRNIISESNNYNTDLHEQLGNYIRFIRDYYKFDIMPMYNCFSNRFIDSFSLPITDERKKGSVIKSGDKLFAFPVRFGHRYSIFCKNNCQATVLLAFFNGKKPLELYYPTAGDERAWIKFDPSYLLISEWEEHVFNVLPIDEYAEIISHNYKNSVQRVLRFNRENLYLFVLLPTANAENIVIIEDNSASVINNTLVNEHLQKPFSDKLIGYLLNYYISPLDPILENIEKYLKILSSKYFYVKDSQGRRIYDNGSYDDDSSGANLLDPMKLENYVQGSFDYITRDFIYNLYRFAGIPDFTGYVDKDVERLIIKDSRDNNIGE